MNFIKYTNRLFVLNTIVLMLLLSSSIINNVNGEIDAETGMECLDRHDNCPFWAATGECEKNPKYMRDYCKKSCDRCKYVRVGSQEEMREFIERQKEELQAKKKIAQAKKDAMKALEGGLEGDGGLSGAGAGGGGTGSSEQKESEKVESKDEL